MATKTLVDVSDQTLEKLGREFNGMLSATALIRTLLGKYTDGDCSVSRADLEKHVPNVVHKAKSPKTVVAEHKGGTHIR